MFGRHARASCLACGLAAVLAPARASAAPEDACSGTGLQTDDEVRSTPPDGAARVALDAPIVLAYAPGIDLDALALALDGGDACAGALACLLGPGAGSAPPRVSTALERLDESTLVLRPQAPLPARSELHVLYARPGFDRPTRGEVTFETGDAIDREPPTLEVDSGGLELLIEPPPEPCDAPEGSLRVRLTVPRPHDDGDPTSVEVLAYLSRAETLDAPALRARARPEDPDQESVTLTLLLAPEEAGESLCVALRAVDGVGRRSETAPEACFDPIAAERSLFTSSCTIRAPAVPTSARDCAAAGLLLLPAAALCRRRKRAQVTA